MKDELILDNDILNEDENVDFLAKTKLEEAQSIIDKAKIKLLNAEISFNKVVESINNKNIEINSLKNNIIDNLLPKVKELYNDLSSDIDIQEAKILNETSEVNEAVSVGKEPYAPSVTNGAFSAIIMALFLGLAITGIFALSVAKKLGINIPTDKLINVNDATAVTEYIGLGFLGQEGNIFIGISLMIAIFLFIFITTFLIRTAIRKSRSLNYAKQYNTKIEDFLIKIEDKEEELKELFSILMLVKKELKIYEALLYEKTYTAKRISVVQHISSIERDPKLSSIMKSISDLVIKLIPLLNAELLKNGEVCADIKSSSKGSKLILNEEISKLYNSDNYLIK